MVLLQTSIFLGTNLGTKIVSNIHFFILAFFIFKAYEEYTEHQEKFDSYQVSKVNLQSQIEKKAKDKTMVKEFLNNVDVAEAKVKEISKKLETLKKRLPSPTEISEEEDMSLLTKITHNLNMKNVNIASEEEENKGSYTIKRYNLQVTGTYLQYLIFLEKMSEFERLINIQSVLLEIPQKKARSRYQLLNTRTIVESFIRNENN